MRPPREIELPPTIERKEYQLDALCGVVNQWEAGHHATLVVMPTGTGKTITAGMISKYCLEELDRKVLFVAHRHELIEQATNTYVQAFGMSTAIEMGTESERDFVNQHGQEPEVVVASVQSLYDERVMNRFRRDRFGLIVVDEAHHIGAPMYQPMLQHFQDYFLLGITATPDGASNNLGKWFDKIAYHRRLSTSIEEGDLVRINVRTIKVPIDLREIKCTGGDFNLGDLAERISPAVETLCYQIHHNIGERITVVFTPDVGSAQAVADMLNKMGRKADYVAGAGGKFGMKKEVRKEKLKRFKAGEFQVIVCCDLLVEGWDMKEVSCVVIARPSTKRYKVVQMIGRGTRTCERIGKTNVLVLDLDWQQDESSRELCTPYSLFAEGDASADALEILAGRVKERKQAGGDKPNEDIDILKELREIELDLHSARVINVKYTGKHTELYMHEDRSPFGVGKVLDIKIRKGKDFDPYMCGPATPSQVTDLHRLGVIGAEKMNLYGASRLLSKLKSRDKNGYASHQQVQFLLANGVGDDQAREAKKKDAAAIIAQIKAKQGEMFL